MSNKAKISIAVFLLGLSLTLWAWWPTVSHLVDLIQTVDVFAHGQIVPFVSLVLIWSRRDILRHIAPSFSIWGLGVFAAANLIWLGGELLDSALLSHIGLITAIQGVVLYAFGAKVYRAILFPMGFLYLMIPFGYALVTHLQYLTANMVIGTLDIIGADFTADGVLIELPSGLYEVAQACAGIRFLFTSIVTSVLLANLVFQSWQRRVMILCVGVILPIIANIIRVLTILAIAEMTDQSFAKDVDHIIYGWVFLSIVLLALISFAYKVSDIDDTDKRNVSVTKIETLSSTSAVPGYALWGILLFSLPVLASLIFPSQFNPSYNENNTEVSALYTTAPTNYRLIGSQALTPTPFFLNADQQKASVLRDNTTVFIVYYANYTELGPGRRLFQSGNSLVPNDWSELTGYHKVLENICGQNVIERQFQKNDARLLVWTIYRLNTKPVSSSLYEKIGSAISRFSGIKPTGEVLVLISLIANDTENARSVFSDFLKANINNGIVWSNDQKLKDTAQCAE